MAKSVSTSTLNRRLGSNVSETFIIDYTNNINCDFTECCHTDLLIDCANFFIKTSVGMESKSF